MIHSGAVFMYGEQDRAATHKVSGDHNFFSLSNAFASFRPFQIWYVYGHCILDGIHLLILILN